LARLYHFAVAMRRAKEAQSTSVKLWKTTLAILAALSASIALADDFKTIDGKEYKKAEVSRVELDGIVITFSGGIVKIPFAELPPEIQQKYGYNPEQAEPYSAQQAAIAALLRNILDLETLDASLQKQEYELLEQIGKAEEAKKHQWPGTEKDLSKMNLLAAQLPALHKQLDDLRAQRSDVRRKLGDARGQLERARQPPQTQQPQQGQPQNVQTLQARYFELDQKQEELNKQIGQAQHGEYQANPNPELQAQLPALFSQRDEIRREKDEIRKQLEQAQH